MCGYLSRDRLICLDTEAQLAAARSGFAAPNAHQILGERLSKEPLAPAVVGGDQRMSDAMTWVVYALIEAEERGITQNNVDAMVSKAEADPSQTALRRFLGIDGGLGSKLGLADDFVVQIIRATGNHNKIRATENHISH